MTVKEIAAALNGTIEGNPDCEISKIAKIEFALKDQISFVSNPLYEKYYESTKAGALLVSKEFNPKNKRTEITLIRVQDPYLAFLDAIELFEVDEGVPFEGISDKCSIGENSEIAVDVSISDYTFIGNNCKISGGTRIYPNCTISSDVEIGKNCILYPNVVLYQGTKIGSNVIIHSGTVIGSDGFGHARQPDGSYKKIPQKGIVVIEDDVEIGSNCSIDRATIGETKLCKGVKLDNQIQIGHNVIISENTVIVAQAGISGSTKIGKRCMIGGQAGLVGHLEIADDVMIGASSGVSKSIPKAGLYTGYRTKPAKEDLKREAYVNKIPELEAKIRLLEKELGKKK